MKEKPSFKLFGIFGYPLSHTLSPVMQEAAFEKAGIKAFYLALELDSREIRQAFSFSREFPLEGFNVTVPYKQTVGRYLDGLTPEARAVGAVNTVFRQGSKYIGTNTDVDGFVTSLEKEARFQPKGKTALVFGAGGASRAVLYGLASRGIQKVMVANRHEDRARKLTRNFSRMFSKITWETVPVKTAALENALNAAELVVNATSVGLKKKDANLFPSGLLKKNRGRKKLFFDLIYHESQTPFLKIAKQKGHRILNGLGMLLYQGARAFEHWTGKPAPVEVMRQALLGALKR